MKPPARRARTITPPTTPPAMAPLLTGAGGSGTADELTAAEGLVGLELESGVVLEGLVDLVIGVVLEVLT